MTEWLPYRKLPATWDLACAMYQAIVIVQGRRGTRALRQRSMKVRDRYRRQAAAWLTQQEVKKRTKAKGMTE